MPHELPSNVSGVIVGNAIARLANSPFTFDQVVIRGDLRIEPGVVVRLAGPNSNDVANTVEGTLTVGAGASLLCASQNYTAVLSAAVTRLEGTRTSRVTLTRSQVGGFNNMCWMFLGTATITYAHVSAVPLSLGGGSVVTDSEFDPLGNNGDRLWLRTRSPAGTSPARFEFNRFVRTEVRGVGFVLRNNLFDGVGGGSYNIWLCTNCVSGGACTGTRGADPRVVVEDNVFTAQVTSTGIIEIDREFGPVRMPNNFFTQVPVPRFSAWNGTSTSGCSDALGAYGGPLTVTPLRTARPVVGPR